MKISFSVWCKMMYNWYSLLSQTSKTLSLLWYNYKAVFIINLSLEKINVLIYKLHSSFMANKVLKFIKLPDIKNCIYCPFVIAIIMLTLLCSLKYILKIKNLMKTLIHYSFVHLSHLLPKYRTNERNVYSDLSITSSSSYTRNKSIAWH